MARVKMVRLGRETFGEVGGQIGLEETFGLFEFREAFAEGFDQPVQFFFKRLKTGMLDMGIYYTKGIGDAIPPANQNLGLPLSFPLA